MTFTHLHVASSYSFRYGASTPEDLVALAADQGMEALALTDRDGLHGAVKFALACISRGVTPLLGVDLAVRPTGALDGLPCGRQPARRRSPVRGGAGRDPRLPRVTVLALGRDGASGSAPAPGWGRLCRLVTATHLGGERGMPVADLDLVAEHAVSRGDGGPALAVLLGPASEVGRAVLARRSDLALAVLDRWRSALPPGSVAVEVVCHRGPEQGLAGLWHAARMLSLARAAGVPAVLTNAVRYATPDGAVTVDVLDAARRLVPLDLRHVDRVSAEGSLTSPAYMRRLAGDVATAAGEGGDGAARLLADTADLAGRCRLDPGSDLELGSTHLPELQVLGLGASADADAVLRAHCEAGIGRRHPGAAPSTVNVILDRLAAELDAIARLGYAAYFLTLEQVCGLIRDLGVRVAARGSGAGSLVNHLLGISGVDPIRYDLLMERFLPPRPGRIPDVDLDVESARRTEVYQAIIDRFGADRVACVAMTETYRVRHAIRDVGAALGLPPAEISAIATAFPHIRARDARRAVGELPELRSSGLAAPALDLLFDLVERLDGLPRHAAMHPCGLLLSDLSLHDRTPVENTLSGFPMSQFDKDDVEDLGLLKLDLLGVRMQSAMAYALTEIARVDGPDAARAGGHPPDAPYLDRETGRIELDGIPHDDETTFRLIRSTHTLGCFQIESPGQRELIGKLVPETFDDLILDISLFRPGPVKSDMITPFLMARHGWEVPRSLHWLVDSPLEETAGVVVFHEQVMKIISHVTGCSLSEADELRRMLGTPEELGRCEERIRAGALGQGCAEEDVQEIWEILLSFGSFGFCKAHAAAFALPTYQSAWLKAHHPAAFLAGVLTHDPGMYPKRLILDEARNLGITVLPLDVNRSGWHYQVERLTDPAHAPQHQDLQGLVPSDPLPDGPGPELPDGRGYGIRLSLADVKGITEAEVDRIVVARPYESLADFWHRARVSRPVVERLVVTGAFDTLHGLGTSLPLGRRDRITRRDLLLQVAGLDRWAPTSRSAPRPVPHPAPRSGLHPAPRSGLANRPRPPAGNASSDSPGPGDLSGTDDPPGSDDPGGCPVQLVLDLGGPVGMAPSGLPEMTAAERVRAELEVLGLDASRHVVDFYAPLLDALGVTRAGEVLTRRSRATLLVAGAKVATQTPLIRSGRRVVFLTLDDATGPVDVTFFQDAQDQHAATVFGSWLLLVSGVLRRTGPRGVSVRATGAWELPALWEVWDEGGITAVRAVLSRAAGPPDVAVGQSHPAVPHPAAPRTVPAGRDGAVFGIGRDEADAATGLPVGDRNRVRRRSGGMGGGQRYRRLAGAGEAGAGAGGGPGTELPRGLWHASQGSSGR